MFEEEIKKLWRNASEEELERFSQIKLMNELDEKLKRTESAIQRRDRLEIIAAMVIVPAFAALAFVLPAALSKIGCAIISAYGVLVIYQLKKVKKYRKPVDMSLPVSEQLLSSKLYYSAEMKLLDNVLWWYLLPPFVGIVFFYAGFTSEGWISFAIHILIAFVVFLAIYILNKQAVQKEFQPLVRNIEEMLKQFDE